jgi:hypothetical protein
MIPANDLRSNLGTWAVADEALPALARSLLTLPTERFDRDFNGQCLVTTYYDTKDFALRKTRQNKSKYITVRVRSYDGQTFALSAKTESEKFRIAITPESAQDPDWPKLLPGNLLARLVELIGDEPLVPVVAVCFRRFAVEDAVNRFTLDIGITTDTGKRFPTNVLEFKSTKKDPPPIKICFRPIKLSKFLWATS